jgi:hypothetical protein
MTSSCARVDRKVPTVVRSHGKPSFWHMYLDERDHADQLNKESPPKCEPCLKTEPVANLSDAR